MSDLDRLLDRWNIATQRWITASELVSLLRNGGADKRARSIAIAYAEQMNRASEEAEEAYYSAVREESKASQMRKAG